MALTLIMVGLPARGKTYTARKLARYLSWLGENTKVFNVGNVRREFTGANVSHHFFDHQNETGLQARKQAAQEALNQMLDWFKTGGEIAIFDATNTTLERRRWLMQQLAKQDIQFAFIESICEDEKIIEDNIRRTKLNSPDYVGYSDTDAIEDFKRRIAHYEAVYETLTEDNVPWIKIIDAGRQVVMNRLHGDRLMKVGYFLMQLNLIPSSIWLSRHGESMYNTQNRVGGDSDLSPNGRFYANSLSNFMQDITIEEIWTSTLKRTIQTASRIGTPIKKWKILDEIHAGICDGKTYEEIRTLYPDIADGRGTDKLRFRYPQGESYEDVIRRVEPIILALEHQTQPILVVAHQAILRAIYGYFAEKPRENVPFLHIPLHTVIHLQPSTYGCEEMRFALPPHLAYTHE